MSRQTFRTIVRIRRRERPAGARFLLLSLLVSFGLLACESDPLAPRAGLPQYRELATTGLPGPARLDLAGGNLLIERIDLDLDTQLGPLSVGAVWNSATRRWTWSFDDIAFANGSFTDATGAVHAIESLAAGAAIPGTTWVKLDSAGPSGPNRVKTKGGLEYTFAMSGRPLSIRWTSSPDPHLKFTQSLQGDGLQHTSAIEQCSGVPLECRPVYTFQYDASGRVRQIEDRAGRRALFTYDAVGNLATARDGLDTATGRPGVRYEYTGNDLTAMMNSEGERVEYVYDAAGRLLRVTQIGAGDPTSSFVYRGRKQSYPYRTFATDPLGAVKIYRYDGEYQLLSVEDGEFAEVTSFTWSAKRVRSRTAPSGETTQWSYVNDDVAFRLEPSGNITTYHYQSDAVDRSAPNQRPLLRRGDLLGMLETRIYDTAGRLVSIANGSGDTLSLEYDDDQMVSSVEDPEGITTFLSGYGDHGHPTVVSRAGIEKKFRYDAVGNLTEGPDLSSGSGPGLGGIVSRTFDEDRNVAVVHVSDLATIVSLQSETVTTVYRSDHRPLLVARPGGGDDLFVYDELGRLNRRRERVDGGWSDTTFGYDAVGRLRAVDGANGSSQRWTYDSLGRATTHAIRKGAVTENFSVLAWEAGRVQSFFDGRSGLEVYSYDGAGRLSVVDYANGDRATLTWDPRSQRTGLSLEDAGGLLLRTISITYDAAGRELGVYDNGTPVIERTWSEGRLRRTQYGNGLVREFSPAPELLGLVGITMTDGTTAVETTTVRLADPECHLTGSRCISSDTTSGGTVATRTSEHHHLMPGIGAAGRPRPGQRVGIEQNTAYELEAGVGYSYDSLSNLLSGPVGEFFYNAERNRLQSIERAADDAVEYQYDAAGFVTSRGGVSLTWDGSGRVSSYGNDTFSWDTVGRPVANNIAGVPTTRRFGGLVEANGAGYPTAIDLGEVRIDLEGNRTRYRHFDYRGNVKLVSDEAGDVVQHYEYSAYAVEAVYGSDTDKRSFARGQSVGDLVLIGHRLYDPAAARFLAPDPIFQLINQYAYTLGNPVQFWDPSGLQAVSNDQAAAAMMQGAGSSLSTIGALTMAAGFASFPIPGVNVTVGTGLLVGGAVLIFVGDQLKARGELLLQTGDSAGVGGGSGDLTTLETLGGIGPLSGGVDGPGCAPISLAAGRLPMGSLGLLLLANLAVAAIVWRRSRVARFVTRNA